MKHLFTKGTVVNIFQMSFNDGLLFEGKAKVSLHGFPSLVTVEPAEKEITKDDKEVIFKGTVKIDPSRKPKHIDLTIEDGIKFIGDTALGIYELDGDTLKWHANQPGKVERPREFPAVQGEVAGGLYLVLKRSK